MARLTSLLDEDDPAILDFDLACTLRLQIYDNEVRKAQAKEMGRELAKALIGDGNAES